MDVTNPNKFRTLIGGFARNMAHFHRADGKGYEFFADQARPTYRLTHVLMRIGGPIAHMPDQHVLCCGSFAPGARVQEQPAARRAAAHSPLRVDEARCIAARADEGTARTDQARRATALITSVHCSAEMCAARR